MKVKVISFTLALSGPAAARAGDSEATPAPTPEATVVPSSGVSDSVLSALSMGGYAEAVYQAAGDSRVADVRRMVLFTGYRFSDTARFVSELEAEHAREFEVEQAYVELAPIAHAPKLRAGLQLVPLGIINLHHEPPTFLGVDRPIVDQLILPSTWREISLAVAGDLGESFHFQVAAMNGLDGDTFTAAGGIGPGRGQGAAAHGNEPAAALRLSTTALLGSEFGVGGYWGGAAADVRELIGARVGIAEVDARVKRAGFSLRGEVVRVWLAQPEKIIAFQRAADPTVDPIGAAEEGAYLEAGYDVLRPLHVEQNELWAFARYEAMDSKSELAAVLAPGSHQRRRYLFSGLEWRPDPKVALKADMRFMLEEPPPAPPPPAGVEDDSIVLRGNTLSLGVGVMF